MENKNKKAFFYALSAVLLWSTASTGFELALKTLTYYQLLYISSSIACIVFYVFVLLERRTGDFFLFKPKDWLLSLLSGLLNPILYYLILLKAYSLLPAQIAQPLNYTWPLILVIISAIFLKQKLHLISIISLLISFLGVLVISTQGNISSLEINEPFGVFLAASSAVVWAFYWILNVKDKRSEVVKLFTGFFIAQILITSYSFLFFRPMFDFQFDSGFWAAVYIAFFEFAFPFYLWLKALQMVSNNAKINNLVYLSPFLALIFIHFILGEKIYFTTLIGLFFILGGIFLSQTAKISTKK